MARRCVAPLGTPANAIRGFNESLNKVLSEPDLAKQLALRGAYLDPMTPPEVNVFVNTQQAQWRPVLQAFEESSKKMTSSYSHPMGVDEEGT